MTTIALTGAGKPAGNLQGDGRESHRSRRRKVPIRPCCRMIAESIFQRALKGEVAQARWLPVHGAYADGNGPHEYRRWPGDAAPPRVLPQPQSRRVRSLWRRQRRGYPGPGRVHPQPATLLNRFGNDSRLRLILFTLDESAYAREMAPLAGHYPALRLAHPGGSTTARMASSATLTRSRDRRTVKHWPVSTMIHAPSSLFQPGTTFGGGCAPTGPLVWSLGE